MKHTHTDTDTQTHRHTDTHTHTHTHTRTTSSNYKSKSDCREPVYSQLITALTGGEGIGPVNDQTYWSVNSLQGIKKKKAADLTVLTELPSADFPVLSVALSVPQIQDIIIGTL